MDGLLTPVSTAYKTSPEAPEPFLVEVKPNTSTPTPAINGSPDTPENILEILRHQPDFETLSSILESLGDQTFSFNFKTPSPISAQFVNVLVADIIPSYWSILKPQGLKTGGRKHERLLLLNCLRSVTGLNAILARMKALIQEEKGSKKDVGAPRKSTALQDLVDAIQEILEQESFLYDVYEDIWQTSGNASKQAALWQEFLALIGGGKILSNSAEAVALINESSNILEDDHWIADGRLYCTWLGRNFFRWTKQIPEGDIAMWKSCSSLMSKSFRLGHTGK